MATLCVLLVSACVFDYRRRMIPNALIVLLAVWGVGWRLALGGACDMAAALLGAALLVGLLYPFFRIGTIGAGDVKLFGATSIFFPFDKILLFLFISLLASAVISLIKLWKEKKLLSRLRLLGSYLSACMEKGAWKAYPQVDGARERSVCLSGPVLFGVLLYLGGAY